MIRCLARIVLLLALAAPVAAQPPELPADGEPRWYTVEIAVFALETLAAEAEEDWGRELNLRYPSRLVALTPGDAPRPAPNTALPAAQEPVSPVPEPFIALPESEHQLVDAVRRLTRRPEYRLLFHERWVQPVFSREETDSVLIRGGDRYGDHFELEGYVTVGVERYLHLNTDLWLSQFAANGLGPSRGSLLPAPPLADVAGGDPTPGIDIFSQPLSQVLNQRYYTKRTVVMRQHRRMRSDELHYLDHPLFGLLIQVTPLELPEEGDEEPTEAEAPAEPLEPVRIPFAPQ